MSIRVLPSPLAEKALLDLKEDENRVNDSVQHLKDWLAKQPYIRARTDDQWLVAFLRGCKYSLEKTKEKLDLYYSCWTTAPELSKIKQTDPLFDGFLNLGVLLILPKTVEPNSSRITIMRVGKWNPEKYHIMDIMSIIWSLSKIVLMDDDQITVAGSVTIVDLEDVSMSLFMQMTPTVIKKLAVIIQEANPIRLTGVHFVNTDIPAFETVFNIMKTILSEHKNTFFVHNRNYEELHKHVPKHILPVEYGGDGNGATEQEMIDDLKNKVKEYSSFLEEESQFGTDELKRPGKPRTAADMFGAEGSFRKLEVD